MKSNYLKINLVLVFIFLLLAAPCALDLGAETTLGTAITTVPYTISARGVYYFTSDLTANIATGNAITISANNVTIDLNGHLLKNSNGTANQAIGIYAYQYKNITLKNGIIRAFYEGIALTDSSPYSSAKSNLIEDIKTESCRYRGIRVEGLGCIIRNNQVVDTGGSTVSGVTGAEGIAVYGTGNLIINNIISDPAGTSSSYGIFLDIADNNVIEFNLISKTDLSGTTYGIFIHDSDDVMVVNNRIFYWDIGVYYSNSSGKYRDNMTANCSTDYSGGTDVGNNN